jgi:hypothetical protein
MADEYPIHLLAREPAPPYTGEGPFALWHFSEDVSLERFEPHVPATNPGAPPLVWAIDTRHAPMFWFPRDCPRACYWAVSTATAEDRQRLLGDSASGRVHVVEERWWARMRTASLFAYRLPPRAFRPHGEVGGYWVADEPVVAEERVVVDHLVGRHERAGIELRSAPSLWPLWEEVVRSTLGFSGHRLHLAEPDGEAP